MSARTKYDQIEHGDWMHLPRAGSKAACCDCGLVRVFQPRIDKRGRIWVRVLRDERASGAVRRGKALAGVAKAIKRGGQG